MIIIVVIRVFFVCVSSVLLEPDIMPVRRDSLFWTSHYALCCHYRRCWLDDADDDDNDDDDDDDDHHHGDDDILIIITSSSL